MTWVVKMGDGLYLYGFGRVSAATFWTSSCERQRDAKRFKSRVSASAMALRLQHHGARVVRLKPRRKP